MITGTHHEDGKREKIIVAGHPYVGYVRMIAGGFAEMGLDVTCLEWQMPERNPLTLMKAKLSYDYANRLNEGITVNCAKLLERAILDLNPDYVLVMDGNEVTKATLNHCSRRGTVIAMWAYDSICNFPWIAKASESYDVAFTHEPEDVEVLSVNCPTKYLPMAYSPEIYHPIIPEVAREVDVFFAGSIRSNYPERTALLRLIGKTFPTLNIRVFSPRISMYSPYRIHDLLIMSAGDDTRVIRGRAGHKEINEMYNRSKICINIHNNQSRKAVSPRTYEILGSSGLLLTDRKIPDSDGFVEGRDYIHYSNEGQMLSRIEDILHDDEGVRRIALGGHSKAKQNHTYSKRAKTILRLLREIPK